MERLPQTVIILLPLFMVIPVYKKLTRLLYVGMCIFGFHCFALVQGKSETERI